MKKGQIITGTIEKVAFPNKGMFTTEEGRTVIVKNTADGICLYPEGTKRQGRRTAS